MGRDRHTVFVFALTLTIAAGVNLVSCGSEEPYGDDQNTDRENGGTDGDTGGVSDTGSDGDTHSGSDTGLNSDTDNDTNTDSDSDTDTDSDSDTAGDSDRDTYTDVPMTSACIGLPSSCDMMLSTCETQLGCTASPGCAGVAPLCFSYDSDQYGCEDTMGCTWNEECGGSSDACVLMFSSVDCMNQEGCTWNTGTESCSGVSSACSAFVSELSCDDQEGCEWEGSCDGAATVCSELTTLSCELQEGCLVSDGCSGAPYSCDTFGTSESCGEQSGCRWSTGVQAPNQSSTIKFCNSATFAGERIELTVIVSAGNTSMSMTAISGECTSPIDDACLEGPIGDVVYAQLQDAEGVVLADGVIIDVESGDELLIYTTTDLGVDIEARTLEAPETCSEVGLVYGD